MGTSEFNHYEGCNRNDPNNCAACALTKPILIDGHMGINYAGWPLAYMQNGIRIPQKFMKYLLKELESDNLVYVDNLEAKLKYHGYDIEVIKRRIKCHLTSHSMK